ncbi:MAG: TlpA family protein disulfide reductase [Sphingobacteriia bacterium]|nr:TlpA family protein disulfide reductase [Sphingobacteriia bacterium]
MRNKLLSKIIAVSFFLSSSCAKLQSDHNDKAVQLPKENKIVIVNFWSIYCAPCIEELPLIESVYKKTKGKKDVTIVTVAFNSHEEINRFLMHRSSDVIGKQFKAANTTINFPIVPVFINSDTIDEISNIVKPNHSNNDRQALITSYYKLVGIPTTIIFFREHEVMRFLGNSGSASMGKKILSTIDSLQSK